MVRVFAFAYGLLSYVMFLATFLYAIGFVGNVVVPKSIDSGAPAPLMEALLINVVLLGIFGLQHSVMARPAFKGWWTKMVPPPVERSTFVLFTNLALALIYWQWRPMTGVIWEVTSPLASIGLQILFWAGWLLVLLSTLIIDHFDLFGMRQVYLYATGKAYHHPEFRVSAFYKHVRHPLLLGFMIAFWSTPVMTQGHLLFAVVTTLYMLIAIQLEEKDLVGFHGQHYEEYQRSVPMILPIGGKKGD
ncbi:MAG: methanethiol S-methyltransferase [Myxococcota bacterium]